MTWGSDTISAKSSKRSLPLSSFIETIKCLLRKRISLSSRSLFSDKSSRRRLPVFSVTKEEVMLVKRMSKTVPLTIFKLKIPSPSLYPTIIIANVAAACAVLRPKIICRSFLLSLKMSCVTSAASHFEKIANDVKMPAIMSGHEPWKKAR